MNHGIGEEKKRVAGGVNYGQLAQFSGVTRTVQLISITNENATFES